MEIPEILIANPRDWFCLVVDLPLWKIWLRQLGWWNSQYMEKIKMFQTTNQHTYMENHGFPDRETHDQFFWRVFHVDVNWLECISYHSWLNHHPTTAQLDQFFYQWTYIYIPRASKSQNMLVDALCTKQHSLYQNILIRSKIYIDTYIYNIL